MKTLQELLHARADGKESRAAQAVVDVQGGRVRLMMGEVGPHPRIVLSVQGNDVSVLKPDDLYRTPNDEADAAADAIRRQMTPDNVQSGGNLPPNSFALKGNAKGQVEAVIREGKLYAGEGGPEILPPAGWNGNPAVDTQTGQTIPRPTSAGGDQDPSGAGDGDQGNGEADGPEAIDHTKFSKDELVEIAGKEGAEIGANATKAEIAAAINQKRGVAATS